MSIGHPGEKPQSSRETDTVRALGAPDIATRDLVEPIHVSASYRRAPDGSYPGGHSYTRDQNPTYDRVEATLARLEGAEEAMLFASGMAAAATLFDVLPEGARVLVPEAMYWTIRSWLIDLDERGRVQLETVAMDDLGAVEHALAQGPTALVWIETPSNPLCTITDIAAVSVLAHAAGALVVCDGTLATPVLVRPLELGADVVMHSATKQLNGHGDVLAGVLATAKADEFWQRLRRERGYRGAVLGPFETWLLGRGLRTLFLRVRRSADTAMELATRLASNPALVEVLYPGLSSHSGHGVAVAQMNGGFGAVVSLRLKGGEKAVRAFVVRLRLFHDATSLGGVESLVEHRALIEGPGTKVPVDLVRLSIGLEDAEDLIRDLEEALSATES
ncbi:MAG: cystathionine gamma-synthase [Hyphomicrobiaceae bacterium]|jgi:cystathionine gamma-synthase